MTRNVGVMDRVIRMAIGLICIYFTIYPAGFLSNDILHVFVGIFGIGNFIVSLMVFCPLYTLANITTYKKDNREPTVPLDPED